MLHRFETTRTADNSIFLINDVPRFGRENVMAAKFWSILVDYWRKQDRAEREVPATVLVLVEVVVIPNFAFETQFLFARAWLWV